MKDKLNGTEESLKKRISTLEEQESGENTELIDQQLRKIVNITDAREMIKSLENRVSDVENHLNKDDLEHQTHNQSTIIETLQKKVIYQSEQLATLSDTIQILQEKVRRIERWRLLTMTDQGDQVKMWGKEAWSSLRELRAHNPKENTLKAPVNSQNIASQYSTYNNDKRNNKVANSLLVLMDSNRQHIEQDKLWHDCKIVKVDLSLEMINC